MSKFKKGDKVYYIQSNNGVKHYHEVDYIKTQENGVDAIYFVGASYMPANRVFHVVEQFEIGDEVTVGVNSFGSELVFKILGIDRDANKVWIKSNVDGSSGVFPLNDLHKVPPYEPKVGDKVRDLTVIAINGTTLWVTGDNGSNYFWSRDKFIDLYKVEGKK